MNSIVENILDLEREYGHEELFNGVNDEEAVLDRLALFLQTLKLVDGTNSPDFSKSYLPSPECAAFLLYLEYPEDDDRFEYLCRIYKARSREDGAIFQAVFYRSRFEETYNELHLFDKYIPINKQYTERYGRGGRNPFVGKGAVYTVITGGYDELKDPEYVDPTLDYYCFTDDPGRYSSDVWMIRALDHIIEGDAARTQRYAKIHPFILLPEYDYTVYVDGSITITGDIKEYMNLFSRESSMLCFPHSSRSTIAEEIEAVKVLRMNVDPGTRNELDEQIERYHAEGYDDSEPLVETGCLVRSNRDKKLNYVMEAWWNEVLNCTCRDQISIGYVCWKSGFRYDISALSIWGNDYLKVNAH